MAVRRSVAVGDEEVQCDFESICPKDFFPITTPKSPADIADANRYTESLQQSGIRESNSFHSLGKAGHDRYTNPAIPEFYRTDRHPQV